MRWSDIDFNPSTRTVRQFGLMWLVFFGGLAASLAVASRWWASLGMASLAVLGASVGQLKPALLRPIYTGWMVLVFPLACTVSYMMLALLYFGLFTPVALLLRLVGRDCLQRRRQPDRGTYWVRLPTETDLRRAFRPF